MRARDQPLTAGREGQVDDRLERSMLDDLAVAQVDEAKTVLRSHGRQGAGGVGDPAGNREQPYLLERPGVEKVQTVLGHTHDRRGAERGKVLARSVEAPPLAGPELDPAVCPPPADQKRGAIGRRPHAPRLVVQANERGGLHGATARARIGASGSRAVTVADGRPPPSSSMPIR